MSSVVDVWGTSEDLSSDAVSATVAAAAGRTPDRVDVGPARVSVTFPDELDPAEVSAVREAVVRMASPRALAVRVSDLEREVEELRAILHDFAEQKDAPSPP